MSSVAWCCSRAGCTLSSGWICKECELCFCREHVKALTGWDDPGVFLCPHCNFDLMTLLYDDDIEVEVPAQDQGHREHEDEDTANLYGFFCERCHTVLATREYIPWQLCQNCEMMMHPCEVGVFSVHCHGCGITFEDAISFLAHCSSEEHRRNAL